MATINYGLSAKGFKRKRLPEIIQSLNNRVSDILGVQIETGSNSIFGQLHGVYAYEIANLWELAENTYNAMYPNTSQGVNLSNAAGLAGIRQITAEKSILYATCFGTEGTTIPYGAQISSLENPAMIFSCNDTDAVISKGAASTVQCSIPSAVSIGATYSITMDGTQKSYTAASGDTKSTVLTAISSQFEFDDRSFTVANDVLTVAMDDASKAFAISTSNNITVSNIGAPVEFVSNESGAINPALGTLTNIVTAYTGWASVTNQAATIVGRNDEQDISLRQRWSASVFDRASAMVEAIQAAIYTNVTGVTSATVYENDSDETDEFDRPPHSIEAVVQGGDPNDIAMEIWRTKAGGIDTYGEQSVEITDSQGVPHTMYFNRPTEVIVWIKVTIAENPDEEISPAAATEVAEAIFAKGLEQKVGEDVILQRYFAAIFNATKGIGYINLTATTGETPDTYGTTNIEISPRELAVFDLSRIEVTVAT